MEQDHAGNLLIVNATMVLPEATLLGDLRVENGTITEVVQGGGRRAG